MKNRTAPTRRRWIKRVLLAVGVLLLVAAGAVTWMFNRPRQCPIVPPGSTGVRVDERGLLANFYPARGAARAPAIMVIGGSEGGLSTEGQREAVALQAAGFNALQIAWHCAPGKPKSPDRVALESFYAGLDWLRGRPMVDAGHLGIVGYSKGAEAALLVATRRSDVKAVVAGMPSSVAWDGFNPIVFVLKGVRSTWTENGQDVPSLPFGSMDSDRGQTYGLHANGLPELRAHPDAIIPVERIQGHVMLVCGELDRVWPACPMTRQIEQRLSAAGRPVPLVLRYPQGGHGVFGPPYPPGDRQERLWGALGGTAASNREARADGWPKVVSFLNDRLNGQPAPSASPPPSSGR